MATTVVTLFLYMNKWQSIQQSPEHVSRNINESGKIIQNLICYQREWHKGKICQQCHAKNLALMTVNVKKGNQETISTTAFIYRVFLFQTNFISSQQRRLSSAYIIDTSDKMMTADKCPHYHCFSPYSIATSQIPYFLSRSHYFQHRFWSSIADLNSKLKIRSKITRNVVKWLKNMGSFHAMLALFFSRDRESYVAFNE